MSYWYRTEVDAAQKRPLLLYLHGHRENAGDAVVQTTTHGPWIEGQHVRNGTVLNELRGFFRVAPHMPGPNEEWDAGRLAQLVRDIRRQHADVSPAGLIIVGISRGGTGALDLIERHGQDLDVAGAVVCCPEHVGPLNPALERAPIYLFHASGDSTVKLDGVRAAHYDSLQGRPNFRWVRVHDDWTLGESRHNCWTDLFGQPALYAWLASVVADQGYRTNKAAWPDFADRSHPKPPASLT